jgi:predicted nucleic acid-binding protein
MKRFLIIPQTADRIIGATALVHGATLITADQRIRRTKAIQTLW